MMAVWSEVLLSEIQASERFDADYWQPSFMENEKNLKAMNCIVLGESSQSIRSGPFGSNLLCDTYVPDGVAVIRPFNLKGMTVERENIAYIPESMCKDAGLAFYGEGDIMIARVGDVRAGVIRDTPSKTTISPNIIAVRLRKGALSPYYVAAFLNTWPGLAQMLRGMKTVAQPTITTDLVRSILVPILDEAVQAGIEAKVRAAFNRDDASRSIYAEAEGMLSSALGLNGLDLTARLFYERPYADLEAAARFDAEYFQPAHEEVIGCCKAYTKGWTTLDDLMAGITNGVECRSFVENGVPYLRVGDIEGLWLNGENASKISHEDANELRSKISLRAGDVVMVRSGSIGQTAVVPDDVSDSILSSHLIRLRQHSPLKIRPLCLALLLSSRVGVAQTKKHNNGGIVPEISQSAVRQFVVPLLDDGLQFDLEGLIQSSFAARREARRLLDEAKRMVEDAILGKDAAQ
ncbi:hypothetical protein JW916_06015 [Candidatus Sumerlaeota bacterium]|nr:hypothetical protein [Candidatus Sumerlaeota bacterium]